ncbi:MAG: FAD-dependent oxidoreductase [Halobacteriales archaeon]|nr:FAD-dependent oxidoreductase [Halobacteriales archaeon]
MTKVVVIGGDAAGMSTASKAKRDDPSLDVTVFERGDWVSYGACGLPYYVKGEIDELDELVAVTPEEFVDERGIDLRTRHEVTAIDADRKVVEVESEDGVFEEPYDSLVVATGARALEPPIDGLELDGVHTFRTMGSGEDVRNEVEDENPDSVGIVGGGYIGVEMAEAFRERGADVRVFEMLPHILAPFGEDVARGVEDHMRDEGVDIHLETAVEGIVGEDGEVSAVRTEEDEYDVDLVIVGAGVKPNVEIAEEAGVETGPTGAIATDEHGRTNLPDIYAVGDCAEARNAVTGESDHVPLALTANRQGRAVGATLAGEPTETGPIVGTAVLKAFELEVARTGVIDHERADEAGFEPVTKTIETNSRAHYYPGGSKITVSMTADRGSGRLLGASMVGEEGVAHRINTVATALHNEMTVEEVEKMDLAYAPPFSPVWDPVLTASKVLSGSLED